MNSTGDPGLFTASEVARFCQVDLKTIHNWCDKGKIRHFRTPGRHMRFRPQDVLDFLRKYGYPIPISVQLNADQSRTKLSVAFVEPLAARRAEIIEKMDTSFEVRVFANPTAALVSLGESPADALVLDMSTSNLELIKALTMIDRLARMRCVIYTESASGEKEARAAGAYDVVTRPMWHVLKDSILRMLGLERPVN